MLRLTLLLGTLLWPLHGAWAKPANATLLEVLAKDRDPLRRESAALALGTSGNRFAVPLLLERLRGDDNRWVRARCAEALGLIGDRSAIDVLRAALDREKLQRVRRTIGEALVRLGSRAGVGELLWQLRVGNQHSRAEAMKFLVRTTTMPLGQDAGGWATYLGAGGYEAIERRVPGSPSVFELRGLATPGGKARREPRLRAKDPPPWQIVPAVVVRLAASSEAVTRRMLRRHELHRQKIPDGYLLIVQQQWTPPAKQRANRRPADQQAPTGRGLTAEAVRYLFDRAPNLIGVGINADRLDITATNGTPATDILSRAGRLIIEGIGDLERVPSDHFRLLVIREKTLREGSYNSLLLGMSP